MEQRLAIIERLKVGETQESIAQEHGVTRQYISVFWRKYLNGGTKALTPNARGRKKGIRLTTAQQKHIRDIISANENPSAAGMRVAKKDNHWFLETAVRLIRREFRITPPNSHVSDLLRSWNVRVTPPTGTDRIGFSQDFYDYINSDIGKEVARREAELKSKWEKENPNFRPKRGRPRKTPEAAAEIDGYDEMDIDYDDPELEAIRKKMAKNLESDVPAPNKRVGKHKKAGNRQKPKRKKRR